MLAPSANKEKPQRGVVIAGAGKTEMVMKIVELSAGMKVLYSKFSGTDVKVNGEEMLVMRDEVSSRLLSN